MRRPSRRQLLENSNGHERWLVSYADFITLLFGFFVVMYAISSVNEGKYRILSETLSAVFDGAPRSVDPIEVGEPPTSADSALVPLAAPEHEPDPDPGNSTMAEVEADLESRFAGMVADHRFTVEDYETWIEVNLDASLLFTPGSAVLAERAGAVLDDLATTLATVPNPVTVEGYTDSFGSGDDGGSNWALSAMRASNVVRGLVQRRLDVRRFAAVGYADNFPVATNATPDGRAKNRRVTLVVAKNDGVQRNLAGVSSARRAAVEMRWLGEGEVSDEATEPGEAVTAVRLDGGGVLFTADPPGGG